MASSRKIDVLYVVGREGDGSELRWSLRSLAAHARNVGHVVVAGYPPDYLGGDVVAHLCPDVSTIKHRNILGSILSAIDAGLVRGDFLYSSDDHFFGIDVDLAEWPYYVRPGRLLSCDDLRRRGFVVSEYDAMLGATKKLLDAHGMRTDLFCNHANTWMSTVDAPRVRELVESADPYDRENYGFEPTCLFMAARLEREPSTPLRVRRDVKLYGFDESAVDGIYSTGDGMSDAMWDYLDATFSTPCKWERR